MTTGSAKMTRGGASGIAAYLMEERLLGYYVDGSDRRQRHSFKVDQVIFDGRQLHGHGWDHLGIDISAGLTFGQFRSLTNGHHPRDDRQLVRPGHRTVVDSKTGESRVEEAHTMAIDTFYAAPKTVSLFCIAASEAGRHDLVRKVIAAHEGAVSEAHGYVESEGRLGRRTVKTPTQVREMAAAGLRTVTKPGHEREGRESRQQGSQSVRVPVRLLGLAVTQHTARPNDETVSSGRLPDPHLHTHDVQLGLAYDDLANKWVSIDDYGLKTTAKRRDADYMGALARNMQQVGIELEMGKFEEGRNGRMPWRVKGISTEAEKFFSTNHARAVKLRETLETVSERAVSEATLQEAMRSSRRRKDIVAKRQDSAPVYGLWADEARTAGISIIDDELAERLARPHAIELEPWADRRAEFFRRFYGVEGVARQDAEFGGREVAEAIARCAEGLSFTVDDRMTLELEVMNELVVQVASKNSAKVRYTTEPMLEAERYVAHALARKAGTHAMTAPRPADVAAAITGLDVSPDAEQLGAIRAATSGRGLTIIEGFAGTGKTTALKAVVAAGRAGKDDKRAAYDQVIVVSTAALTARSTAGKVGADLGCSLASFIARVEQAKFTVTANTLVIHDEAPMADTWTQQEFMRAAGNAQLIMVGDPEQAQSIGPGGTFNDAVRKHGARQLTKVWRHTDRRDTIAFAKLRSGEPDEAIESLAQRGKFHVADTHAARVDEALAVLKQYREAGKEAGDVRLIFDSSNRAVDEANRHVQRYRRGRGEISARSITVEARDANRQWTLHERDLVLFLKPTDTSAGRVPNGSSGTILAIDAERHRVTVALDDPGRTAAKAGSASGDPKVVSVKLEASAKTQPIGLAYAVHTAKYQGAEVPIVLGLPGGAGTTDKHKAYSTLTRCVDEVHVFTDRETHGDDPATTLKGVWAMTPGKQTAMSRHDHNLHERVAASGTHAPPAPSAAELEYLARIERVAGLNVAEAIKTAPAYPSLINRLDELKAAKFNESDLLARAIRQRELTSADDAAAVLVHRLDKIERSTSRDDSLGLDSPAMPTPARPRHIASTPTIDTPIDPSAATYVGLHRRDDELATALRPNRTDDAMRRAFELRDQNEQTQLAVERNAQARNEDHTTGLELS